MRKGQSSVVLLSLFIARVCVRDVVRSDAHIFYRVELELELELEFDTMSPRECASPVPFSSLSSSQFSPSRMRHFLRLLIQQMSQRRGQKKKGVVIPFGTGAEVSCLSTTPFSTTY